MSQFVGVFLLVWLTLSIVLNRFLLANGEETPPIMQSKRNRSHYRFNIPKDDVFHDTRVIPVDHQVSAFLYQGETKLYFLLNDRENTPLSITVTPCTSSVFMAIRFRPQNDTGKLEETPRSGEKQPPALEEYSGRESHTFAVKRASLGLYVVQVTPLERETYVNMYASLEPGGPHPLQLPQHPNIRLQKRQRRKRLHVRWEPSSVDPHLMHYCLVVNTRRSYPTLCEAQGDRYGVSPPALTHHAGFNFPRERTDAHKSELASKAAKLNASRLGRGSGTGVGTLHEDILVGCVGRKTHYTLQDLEQGKVYHFNLFAVNKKTNLSFSYGNTTLKYDHRTRPEGLRDGKPVTVNLKRLDGRATFKFKVGARFEHEVHFYVMPCGGAVDVELMLKNEVVIPRRRVEGYGRLKVGSAAPGQRYTLKVTAPNPEELRQIAGVEVVATSRPMDKFPLPELPDKTIVHEYVSKRKCNSVLVGWVASPDKFATEYFIYVTENRKKELDLATPNQCLLGRKLTNTGFGIRIRQDRLPGDDSRVMTQEISNLKPNMSYVVQVTVNKKRGKTLSYDLLQVKTKPHCETSRRYGS